MIEKPWWEIWPGRMEAELDAFKSAGIQWNRDEAAFNKEKLLKLRLQYPWHGAVIELGVIYPPFYPYFRPEVFAQPAAFLRHQNPIVGNLCLLGRGTFNWNPAWTALELIQNQLPLMERAAVTTNQLERMALEEPLGEPVTTFFWYCPDSMILIDSSKTVGPEHESGALKVIINPDILPRIQAQVIELRAPNGKKLYSLDKIPIRGKEIPASWIRVANPPYVRTANEFERELISRSLITPARFSHKIGAWFIDLVGILLPEEQQQGVRGEGWMFLVRLKQDKTQFTKTELVRVGRVGRSDFDARIPTLTFLQKKRVALMGLGSVGAPIAVELARSGIGELSLIDCDFVEPGSVVRWPFGQTAFGLQKTFALKQFINANYPYTKVEAVDYRFGVANGTEETAKLQKMLSQADLIIDATAEVGIHQFLSDLAKGNKRPFVFAYLTTGGYGGLVACIDPNKVMGCWYCLQIALLEDKSIPEPPFIENANVQPTGCAERTSTFPGFDATEISLEAARVAIGGLGDGSAGQYPKPKWDVAIAKFRSDENERIPPLWAVHSLPRNPKCPLCK